MKSRSSASTLTPEQRGLLTWLLAVLTIAAFALIGPLPTWIPAIAVGGIMLRLLRLRRNQGTFPARLLISFAIVGAAGVFAQFHTLNGREPGVALLLFAGALKSHETRSQRDIIVLIYLGYLLVLARFLFDQSLPWVAYGLSLTGALTFILHRLHAGPNPPDWKFLAKNTLAQLTAALPLTVLLFAVFPRIEGPLWGRAPHNPAGVTGLSNILDPGRIARLAQSQAVAFRAHFAGKPPPRADLYWRAYVLDRFNGYQWLPSTHHKASVGKLEEKGRAWHYTMLLQASSHHAVPALDIPIEPPAGLRLMVGHTLRAIKPINQTVEYPLTSILRHRLDTKLSAASREAALQLPPGTAPRTRTLALRWKHSSNTSQGVIERALAFFHTQDFYYTLNPPPLHGDITDDFLFDTRKGYCEQYASAFAVLMRAAGVPARIVVGYAGGEWNPVLHYFLVHQANAHAWVEVWLSGRGWTRVDPTAAIAKNRVQPGAASAAALMETNSSFQFNGIRAWLNQVNLGWDSARYFWELSIIAFGPEQQRAFLHSLGLATGATIQGLYIAAGVVFLFVVIGLVELFPRSSSPTDPAQRLYRRWITDLGRRGMSPAPGEAPQDFAERVANAWPEKSEQARRIARFYEKTRYAQAQADEYTRRLAVLSKLVKTFK